MILLTFEMARTKITAAAEKAAKTIREDEEKRRREEEEANAEKEKPMTRRRSQMTNPTSLRMTEINLIRTPPLRIQQRPAAAGSHIGASSATRTPRIWLTCSSTSDSAGLLRYL